MTTHDIAVVDTNIIAALESYGPPELPAKMLITTVTLCGPNNF
ncbi:MULTISPECIES: hypothetical protein [unclassified Frankia]|nr:MULTISPECIES: hypothetical protein [unclassified Frankia]